MSGKMNETTGKANETTGKVNEKNAVREGEKTDWVSLGKSMKKIRSNAGVTQEEAAKIFNVSRTVYTKYENGRARPSMEGVAAFAEKFQVSPKELMKKCSVAIPDTCALLKNEQLLKMLLEDYAQVVIPTTVMGELSFLKTRKRTPQERKNANAAWRALANIDSYMRECPEQVFKVHNNACRVPESVPDVRNLINDHKVMSIAKELEKEVIGDVVIIHDDVDFSVYDGKAIKLGDYIAGRSKLIDYGLLNELDLEYDDLERCRELAKDMDLNAYLPDGKTLLISAIKCNDPEKVKARGGKRIPCEKILAKIRFLLENGADPDKNDHGKYCLSPLAHCMQLKFSKVGYRYDHDIYEILMEAGCDFNKASRDEMVSSYLKVGKLNEGNTPLMIACFHGKKEFVHKLCRLDGISLNQQDSNGYTALTKCAVQRFKRLQKGQRVSVYEEIYQYLINEAGADPLIRDRNNHTAQDWWRRGDDGNYRKEEQW